jgi:SSS family solute:Na+ symporter
VLPNKIAMRWVDLVLVFVYVVASAWVGLRFARRQTSTEAYFVARRSVPSWAIGMSMMATLVSSVTFIAYPGSAYGSNWANLVPGFMLLAVLVVAARVLIPFYREAVRMTAYEYFGHRFGTPTRIYSSIAFSLSHFGKMGFVYYLVALTANSVTGWNIDAIILTIGLVTVLYTVLGGIEAVVWTDVVQGFVMWLGILLALGFLLLLPPGGPVAVFEVAAAHGKFSLGELSWDFSRATIPVLLLYGFFWYLQKYAADQTLVQRYLLARSDGGAVRGIAIGALQTVPVWALFMLIGTCTWSFYKLTGIALPAHIRKADQVFPYFLATQLPPGAAGIFLAALMAAAMSTLASDLNCISMVGVEDVYRRLRPQATDAMRLRMGKILVAVFGGLGMLMAEILAHGTGSALALWFNASAILSAGLAGLFLLAFLSSRVNARGIYTGIAACVLVTAWATLTSGNERWLDLKGFNYPWHELTIGATGHVVLAVTGYLASLLFGGKRDDSAVTLWSWWRARHASRQRVAAPV